jgi:hypothetical protein
VGLYGIQNGRGARAPPAPPLDPSLSVPTIPVKMSFGLFIPRLLALGCSVELRIVIC